MEIILEGFISTGVGKVYIRNENPNSESRDIRRKTGERVKGEKRTEDGGSTMEDCAEGKLKIENCKLQIGGSFPRISEIRSPNEAPISKMRWQNQ